VGDPFDDPLVGNADSGQDIHPNEICLRRVSHRQGGSAVVPQNVDPQGDIESTSHFDRQGSHMSNGPGWNVTRKEGMGDSSEI
jgi:hypothetical protein